MVINHDVSFLHDLTQMDFLLNSQEPRLVSLHSLLLTAIVRFFNIQLFAAVSRLFDLEYFRTRDDHHSIVVKIVYWQLTLLSLTPAFK